METPKGLTQNDDDIRPLEEDELKEIEERSKFLSSAGLKVLMVCVGPVDFDYRWDVMDCENEEDMLRMWLSPNRRV